MAKGAIHRVWADYDVTYGGRRGIMIHASMAITERRSAQSPQVLLIYWFYYTDGKPVPGVSGEFTDSGGNACVFEPVDTPYQSTGYDDFSALVPYEALSHQGSGSFSAYANAALFEGDTVIAWAPKVLSFTLTMQDVHGHEKGGQTQPQRTTRTTTTMTAPNTGDSGGGGRSFGGQSPAQFGQILPVVFGKTVHQPPKALQRAPRRHQAGVQVHAWDGRQGRPQAGVLRRRRGQVSRCGPRARDR